MSQTGPRALSSSSLFDDLQARSLDYYQRAIDSYVDQMDSVPGVICIAQFGTIKAPGISDIDLLLVCEDSAFRECDAMSEAAVEKADPERYGFWHAVTVIPASLLDASRILHTFQGLTALSGDASVIEAGDRPSSQLRLINTVVWNSYFWNAVAWLGGQPVSLRSVILLTGNVHQSVSADCQITGDAMPEAASPGARAETRMRIMASEDPGERQRMAVDGLAGAITLWREADRSLDEWWQRNGCPATGDPAPIKLSRRRKVVFERRQGAADQVSGGQSLVLPPVYSDVLRLVAPYCVERVAKTLGPPASPASEAFSGKPGWEQAFNQYGAALMAVREFLQAQTGDEMALFGHSFVFPFGLPGPTRLQSATTRLRAIGGRLLRR